MTWIFWKILFCFSCLYKELAFLKTVFLLAEFYFIFLKNVLDGTSKAFMGNLDRSENILALELPKL